MIFEDDLSVEKEEGDFLTMPYYASKLPDWWELLYFSWCNTYLKSRAYTRFFEKVDRVLCMHHFAISHSAACKLYRRVERAINSPLHTPRGAFLARDQLMSLFISEHQLSAFKTKRKFSHQVSRGTRGSDISPE